MSESIDTDPVVLHSKSISEKKSVTWQLQISSEDITKKLMGWASYTQMFSEHLIYRMLCSIAWAPMGMRFLGIPRIYLEAATTHVVPVTDDD